MTFQGHSATAMDRFTISHNVASALPEMLVVIVLARGISNAPPNASTAGMASAAAQQALAGLAATPDARTHPRIAHYRNVLKESAGISAKKFPQSNESLLKRLAKTQAAPAPINPLVDLYNAISMKHAVTAGAFDLEALAQLDKGGAVELRFSQAGDSFTALDAGPLAAATAVPAGEASYCVGDVVLTRQLAWRQSSQGLVVPETRNVVVMSEVMDESSQAAAVAETVRAELELAIKAAFPGAETATAILGHARGALDLDITHAWSRLPQQG